MGKRGMFLCFICMLALSLCVGCRAFNRCGGGSCSSGSCSSGDCGSGGCASGNCGTKSYGDVHYGSAAPTPATQPGVMELPTGTKSKY